MGYMHINNLYKDQRVLLFKECYALEKIHGTSAHVGWKDGGLKFFAGGCSHEMFVGLFDVVKLAQGFQEMGHDNVTVYGEAYGGSCQGMSSTYGKALKFVAFDVLVGETWLCVPNAQDVCEKLGLEFVYWEKGPATVEWLDGQRDAFSVQSRRNGIEEPKVKEGVVIRPILEMKASNGERVMAKHKRAEFGETKTPREVNPDQLQVLVGAEAVAQEWVTVTRLEHVRDAVAAQLGITSEEVLDMKYTPRISTAMQEDIQREAGAEVMWSKEVGKAVGKETVRMWKVLVGRVE